MVVNYNHLNARHLTAYCIVQVWHSWQLLAGPMDKTACQCLLRCRAALYQPEFSQRMGATRINNKVFLWGFDSLRLWELAKSLMRDCSLFVWCWSLKSVSRQLGREDVHEMGKARRNCDWHRWPRSHENGQEPLLIPFATSKPPALMMGGDRQGKLACAVTEPSTFGLGIDKLKGEVWQWLEFLHYQGEPAGQGQCV